jgi:radical SAM protein with 4Fe4S-binding SPASM domain
MERRNEKMPEGLFLKIMEDLKGIPREIPFAVSPFKVNEPLLDGAIFEKMATINRELPNATIWLTTNLNAANKEMIEKLACVKRLGYVWVSLNSLRTDEYRELMGLSLEKTLENLRLLLARNRQHQFTDQITLGRVADNTPGDERFLGDARTVVEGYTLGKDYTASIMRRGGWMGYTVPQSGRLATYPCSRWFEISVTCTGEVAFCCMDGKCEYPMGNVNEKNLLDIYNEPSYRQLREKGYQRQYIEPCKDCSFV